VFQIDLNFIDRALRIQTSDGRRWQMPLHAQSVADFYAAIMAALSDVGIEVHINEFPNELPDPVRFSEDRLHAAYDADYAQRFLRVLLQADRVFKAFRTSFIGKCSPVHFFWGSFDLAVTRFSGRRAPRHPGGVPNFSDEVACEAYSHEVSSAGFWPGGGIDYPAFYSYAYPMPEGFRSAPVQPEAAFFSQELGEFYCHMRRCEQRRRRIGRSWTSCKAPMKPQPKPANGTAQRSNAHREFHVYRVQLARARATSRPMVTGKPQTKLGNRSGVAPPPQSLMAVLQNSAIGASDSRRPI
jgi:Family of unknown function (DUF5996)